MTSPQAPAKTSSSGVPGFFRDPGLLDYLHLCEGLNYALFACANVTYFPVSMLTLYLIETSFNAFANRADPDQAALVRAA